MPRAGFSGSGCFPVPASTAKGPELEAGFVIDILGNAIGGAQVPDRKKKTEKVRHRKGNSSDSFRTCCRRMMITGLLNFIIDNL